MDRNIVTRADVEREEAQSGEQGERHAQALGGAKGAGAESGYEDRVDGKEPGGKRQDRPEERLLKYIPTETIGLYLILDGAIRQTPAGVARQIGLWLVFLFCGVLTVGYLRRFWKIRRWSQIGISEGAYLAWVIGQGGVFATYDWYQPGYGAAVVIAYAAVAAFVEPERPTSGQRRRK